MRLTYRCSGPGKHWFGSLLVIVGSQAAAPAKASGCAGSARFDSCFDANSLWLPAGRAGFVSLPDTRANAVGQVSTGFASELLRAPVLLHVASPDRTGRVVNVVGDAFDMSFFLSAGVLPDLELSLAASIRAYQYGAGAGGVTSQSAPAVASSTARDPRLGLGYSLDRALAQPGLGLRLGLEVSLPLGAEATFSGEPSVVAMPSATFAWQASRVALRASLGARVRRALDFGDVNLGNQGFFALGVGVDFLRPGVLFASIEAFGLPPLTSSLAPGASPALTSATLFPAEWILAVRSSFGQDPRDWSFSLGAGTAIPLSRETRETATGPVSDHFAGLTAPAFRALAVLRVSSFAHAPSSAVR